LGLSRHNGVEKHSSTTQKGLVLIVAPAPAKEQTEGDCSPGSSQKIKELYAQQMAQ
jgi:hypothetical protein